MLFAPFCHILPSLRLPFWQVAVVCKLASLAVLGSALLASFNLPAAETYELRSAEKVDSHFETKVVVQVEGQLKLNADGSSVKRLPVKVDANLHYVQRTLAASGGFTASRVVRHYTAAAAKIKLKETELTNTLRDERNLIVVDSSDKAATTFSPFGPLNRDEIDLVEVPGSGLAHSALLPEKGVAIGDTWTHPDWAIARLLNLDAVNQQDIVSKLTDVRENVAIVALEGKVAGAVGGVSSDLELKGKLNFDLKTKAVTWLALAFKENRAIGHAQPGFEVITQMRHLAAPIAASDLVADKALASLPLEVSPGATLVEFSAEKADFELLLDRRWRVMVDRHDVTLMRLVDRGDLVAQCNISQRPTLPKGEQLALQVFQADVQKALGKNFGQIVSAASETTDSGLHILRVTVSGASGELPIQWTYYHVSDDAGHRAALVFTIEGNLVERFAQIDRELISGFRFLQEKQPTPAQPAGPELKTAQEPGQTRKD
ncbi:MAG: hypothetical protein SFU86_00530 [Pirellulaceae bacterium]|nr:hypothetical protein [Pirellulaceae bacterium]